MISKFFKKIFILFFLVLNFSAAYAVKPSHCPLQAQKFNVRPDASRFSGASDFSKDYAIRKIVGYYRESCLSKPTKNRFYGNSPEKVLKTFQGDVSNIIPPVVVKKSDVDAKSKLSPVVVKKEIEEPEHDTTEKVVVSVPEKTGCEGVSVNVAAVLRKERKSCSFHRSCDSVLKSQKPKDDKKQKKATVKPTAKKREREELSLSKPKTDIHEPDKKRKCGTTKRESCKPQEMLFEIHYPEGFEPQSVKATAIMPLMQKKPNALECLAQVALKEFSTPGEVFALTASINKERWGCISIIVKSLIKNLEGIESLFSKKVMVQLVDFESLKRNAVDAKKFFEALNRHISDIKAVDLTGESFVKIQFAKANVENIIEILQLKQ